MNIELLKLILSFILNFSDTSSSNKLIDI